jgi:hypothetical protein
LPAFNGLLSAPHNKIVLDLIYNYAWWHALGKLRLHTDSTVAALQAANTDYGRSICVFVNKTCKVFQTGKLPRKVAARQRCEAKAVTEAIKHGQPLPKSGGKPAQLEKKFPTTHYKLHAPSHLPNNIVNFGTTENYSTERVQGISTFILTYTDDHCLGQAQAWQCQGLLCTHQQE